MQEKCFLAGGVCSFSISYIHKTTHCILTREAKHFSWCTGCFPSTISEEVEQRKAQIRWNRIETDCTSKQTAIQIHSFISSHSDLVYISSRAAFISLGTHFPLIKGWIMSVIMIIHILTTLSATQLHHYAYEMQMKYLRKIWIINALHIITLSCWLAAAMLLLSRGRQIVSSVVVNRRLNVKCKQIWISNLGGYLWLALWMVVSIFQWFNINTVSCIFWRSFADMWIVLYLNTVIYTSFFIS